MITLGLNLLHPDASAAIFEGGRLRFAISEERLNRKKHCGGIPVLAIRACLLAIGVRAIDVDHVAIGRDVSANRRQRIGYALSHPLQGASYLRLARRRTRYTQLKAILAEATGEDPAKFRFEEHAVEHHVAHIASSYLTSPWDHCAALSYDGSGDFVSTMLADCEGNQVRVLRRTFLPDSLGNLYSLISDFIGFRQYGDEGKVMGLAPYGTDRLYEKLSKLLILENGGFRLNRRYLLPFGSELDIQEDVLTSLRYFSDAMTKEFGPPRNPADDLSARDRDLALAVQRLFEESSIHLLKELHQHVPLSRLVLSGGAALNSVANGKMLSSTPFRESWVHAAPGDDGLAVGAALYAYHCILGQPRQETCSLASLGPEYSDAAMRRALEAEGVCYQRFERSTLLDAVAHRLQRGEIVGWFQGRMEWGPRALGNRSILAHPGLPGIKEVLNARVKRREAFRPFAPSVLAERQHEYFESAHPTPFMSHVFKVRQQHAARLSAITHVDGTARLQTVHRHANEIYYDLIRRFDELTGVPILLNTSFNENEPIVCSPEEAVACFKRTRMDALAIGNFLATKEQT